MKLDYFNINKANLWANRILQEIKETRQQG